MASAAAKEQIVARFKDAATKAGLSERTIAANSSGDVLVIGEGIAHDTARQLAAKAGARIDLLKEFRLVPLGDKRRVYIERAFSVLLVLAFVALIVLLSPWIRRTTGAAATMLSTLLAASGLADAGKDL